MSLGSLKLQAQKWITSMTSPVSQRTFQRRIRLTSFKCLSWFATNKENKMQHVIREINKFPHAKDGFSLFLILLISDEAKLYRPVYMHSMRTVVQIFTFNKSSVRALDHKQLLHYHSVALSFLLIHGRDPRLGCLSILWPSLQSLTAGDCSQSLWGIVGIEPRSRKRGHNKPAYRNSCSYQKKNPLSGRKNVCALIW